MSPTSYHLLHPAMDRKCSSFYRDRDKVWIPIDVKHLRTVVAPSHTIMLIHHRKGDIWKVILPALAG